MSNKLTSFLPFQMSQIDAFKSEYLVDRQKTPLRDGRVSNDTLAHIWSNINPENAHQFDGARVPKCSLLSRKLKDCHRPGLPRLIDQEI